MIFVVVKNKNIPGCAALGTQPGKEVCDFKKKINKLYVHRGIQIVTITRPASYGEYAPYKIVSSYDALEKEAEKLANPIDDIQNTTNFGNLAVKQTSIFGNT